MDAAPGSQVGHKKVLHNGPKIQHGMTDDQIRDELQHGSGDGKIYQFTGSLSNLNCRSLCQALVRPMNEYKYHNSTIAVWESEKMIVYTTDGLPDHKAWYLVFFTFVQFNNTTYHLYGDVNRDLYELQLDPNLACCQPRDMRITECNGYKCRLTYRNNDVHCRSCEGLNASVLFSLIRSECKFADIKQSQIIAYIKMQEDIDWTDEKVVDQQLAFVSQDQQTIVNLVAAGQPGGRYDQEIQAFIARMEQQKLVDRQIVAGLRNKYGGDIDRVQQLITAKKHEFVSARAAIEREKKQHREKEEEQAKQRQLELLLRQQQELARQIAIVKDSLPSCADGGV